QDDYIDNTDTLGTSMKENYLLFEAYLAEFELYELFDENSIESEVSGITLSCFLSSKNANSSKIVKQPLKRQRTDPIWTIIEETIDKNYCNPILKEKYLNEEDLVEIN
ncbi:34809_t:CDS:2, partial [Gigaspora margarita]